MQTNWNKALDRLLGSPVLEALAAPHGVERYLEQMNPLWSLGQVRARVVRLRAETQDSTTVTLKPNRHWRGFQAGQYVRAGFEIGGVRRSRCYSLSSSPLREDGLIEITVKRQDAGLVSGHVQRALQPGDVLSLSQAEGDFLLPAQRPARLLLIGGGSGVTPLMSMLRCLADEGHVGEIVFLHYARGPGDALFGPELAEMPRRLPGLRRVEVNTRAPGGAHFSRAQLEQQLPDYAGLPAYVCGPAGLIASVQQLWSEQGMAPNLRLERFTAQPAATAAAGDTTGELRFLRSERYAANDGRSLLDQAEAAGLRPESGCRMGICHSCTCRKTRGVVRDVRNGRLSSAEDEDIQLCVSVPVGDVTLDL